MRTVSCLVAVLIGVVGLVAAARPAHAQVAEQLFREGKRLMSEGKIAEACTAFEGSYRKEAAVTTLLNLADCREKNGQYASAWGHFIDAERKTRGSAADAGFNSTAKDRASKLEGRLSYLIINVPDEARVDGLEITRNGQPVDAAEWNRDIPVDGGVWKVEGKAPAYEAWSTEVKVAKEKDKQSVNVPRFRALPKDERPTGPEEPLPEGPAPSSFTGKRKAALGVGAVGVVGLVAGTVIYFQASGIYNDAKEATTTAERTRLTDDANGKYLVAQIGWGVGAAAVGAAAFLWFTGGPLAAAERADETGMILAPHVDSHSAGFVLGGHF
jgi:hypothetical protein